MKLTCEQLQDKYSDYFEHILSVSEVENFERHLATCGDCRADYHTFATMFQFLDRVDVEEVDAPAGLRADILSVIAQRPAARMFNLKDWVTGLLVKPQLLWGSGLAAAALLVMAIVLVAHIPSHGQGNGVISGGMGLPGSNSVSATAPGPLLQNVTLKEGEQNFDYEVFTLHTPSSLNEPLNVNAYVLQSGDPISDSTMENDTDKATPAWSGSLEPNVSLSLPVSVTSDLPAGTSLNLLLHWTAQDGTSGREVAFVPVTAAASSPTPVAAGSSFYDAVRTISGEYQQTIVADNSALSALSTAGPLTGTSGSELNAEDALKAALGPANFTIKSTAGGYYLISHP